VHREHRGWRAKLVGDEGGHQQESDDERAKDLRGSPTGARAHETPHNARLTMPPLPLEYSGREAIAAFFDYRNRVRGTYLRLLPTRANGQPAFGCYLRRER
jgi:hypothetical protein